MLYLLKIQAQIYFDTLPKPSLELIWKIEFFLSTKPYLMKNRLLFAGVFLAGLLAILPEADAQSPVFTIDLNSPASNTSGFLNGLDLDDVGATSAVPEAAALGLNLGITFAGIDGTSSAANPVAVEVSTTALGIDSAPGSVNDPSSGPPQFNAATADFFGNLPPTDESLTLSFDQTVGVTQIDLQSLDGEDVFQFGSLTLTEGDTGGVEDTIVFGVADALIIPANTDSGPVVPEPSSLALLGLSGLALVSRRKRA